MSFIRFEMLSLMQSMHALGLMPNEDYERERGRLVALLVEEDCRTVPLGPNPFERSSIFDHLFADDLVESENPEVGTAHHFDWRFLIAKLLNASHGDPSEYTDDVEGEMTHLAVRPHAACSQTTLSSELLGRSQKSDRALGRLNELGGEVDALRAELEELRAKVGQMSRHNTEGIGSSERAGRHGQTSASNATEIAQLQEELAQCHMNAIRYEGKGEHFFAGDWRGKAAALESRLRALGA